LVRILKFKLVHVAQQIYKVELEFHELVLQHQFVELQLESIKNAFGKNSDIGMENLENFENRVSTMLKTHRGLTNQITEAHMNLLQDYKDGMLLIRKLNGQLSLADMQKMEEYLLNQRK